jgi:hypothetical protein
VQQRLARQGSSSAEARHCRRGVTPAAGETRTGKGE